MIDHENGGELITVLIRNPTGPQSEAEKLAIEETEERNSAIKEAELQSVSGSDKRKASFGVGGPCDSRNLHRRHHGSMV